MCDLHGQSSRWSLWGFSLFTFHLHLGFHTWGETGGGEEEAEPSLRTPLLHKSGSAALAALARLRRMPAECQAPGTLRGVSWPRRTTARYFAALALAEEEKFRDSSTVTRLGRDRAQIRIRFCRMPQGPSAPLRSLAHPDRNSGFNSPENARYDPALL